MSVPPVDLVAESASVPVAVRRPAHGAWVLRRLLAGVLVLVAVSVLVFAATQALPSDPARAILGREAPPEQLEAMRVQLGLDKPLVQQYLSWLGGAVTGDLGDSLSASKPVFSLLRPAAINSLTLVFLVILIALPINLFFGVMSAVRRDGRFDRTALVGSLVVTAVPEFVIGLSLVFVFATGLMSLLPGVALIPPGSTAIEHPAELVLPVATLVLAVSPYLYRLVRASMIETLESDYVTMARLKGIPESRVIRRHVLRNAMIPVIQGVAVSLTFLLGGIVVIEFVFGFPGVGTLLIDAVSHRDLPVIQGVVLLFAVCVVLFNLAADFLTVMVSPRLRTGGRK